jgi:hypothetical protein
MEKTIEIPADAETVTLKLEKPCGFTLRSLLPQINNEVELVVIDDFGRGLKSDVDLYRLKTDNGKSLLHKLTRSRIVEGESLLDLTPSLKVTNPIPQLWNGSIVIASGTGVLQLFVRPPCPNEED